MSAMKKSSKKTVLTVLVLSSVLVVIILVLFLNSKSKTIEPICGTPENSIATITEEKNEEFSTVTEDEEESSTTEDEEESTEDNNDVILTFSDVESELIKNGSNIIVQNPENIMKRFQDNVPGTWTNVETQFENCQVLDENYNPIGDNSYVSYVSTIYSGSFATTTYEPYSGDTSCQITYDEVHHIVRPLNIKLYSSDCNNVVDTVEDILYYATNNEIIATWVSKGDAPTTDATPYTFYDTVDVEGGQWDFTLSREESQGDVCAIYFRMNYLPSNYLSLDYFSNTKNQESCDNSVADNLQNGVDISSTVFLNALDRVVSDEETEIEDKVVDEAHRQQNLAQMKSLATEPVNEIAENLEVFKSALRENGYPLVESMISYTINNFDDVIISDYDSDSSEITVYYMINYTGADDDADKVPVGQNHGPMEIQYDYDKDTGLSVTLTSDSDLREPLKEWFETLNKYTLEYSRDDTIVEGHFKLG